MYNTFFSKFATYVEGVNGGCNQVDGDDSFNGVEKYENTTHYIKEEDHHNFVGSLTPINIWEVYNHKSIGGE
jgi:hypothetical protein